MMARGPFYEESLYWVKLTNQQLGKASTGNPQIVLTFLVLGRVNPADPEGKLLPVQQYERNMYWVITDKTKDFLPDNLQRIGFDGSAPSQLDLNHAQCCNLRGKEFSLFCKHDEYPKGSGKVREKWSLGKEAQAVQPLDSLEMRRLDSMFGKKLAGTAKKKVAPKVPRQSQEIAAATADDFEERNGNGNTIEPADINAELADAENGDDIPF